MNCQKHPYQPIIIKEGEPFFLENKLIVALLEEFGTDTFIELLRSDKRYSVHDKEQFFQLIGMKCVHFIDKDDFTPESRDDVREMIQPKKHR